MLVAGRVLCAVHLCVCYYIAALMCVARVVSARPSCVLCCANTVFVCSAILLLFCVALHSLIATVPTLELVLYNIHSPPHIGLY